MSEETEQGTVVRANLTAPFPQRRQQHPRVTEGSMLDASGWRMHVAAARESADHCSSSTD